MNTSSGAMPSAAPVAAAEIPAFRRFVWSVRRELWEYRWVYLAPAVAGALAIAAFLVGILRDPGTLYTALSNHEMNQKNLFDQPYTLAALLVLATSFLVGLFYCIDALHSERRDRSILFWKSLPVSDGLAVLSKVAVPMFVVPAIGFALTIAVQFVILVLGSAVVLLTGRAVAPLWTHFSLVRFPAELLYHLVTAHILWYAPVYGWLFLMSAWARRAPILWATVPPLAVAAIEKIAFNTTHVAHMITNRLVGAPDPASAGMNADPLMPIGLGSFLSDPGLWIGLAVAGIFLYATARIRRQRGPV